MSKRTVKVKTVQSNNKEVAEMFNQMLGAGALNLNICYPKYCNIRSSLENLLNVIKLLKQSPAVCRYAEFNSDIADMDKFIADSTLHIQTLFDVDLKEYEWNLSNVPEALAEKFKVRYEELKKDNLVNTFIMVCNSLIVYRKHLADKNNLNHKFILNMPGVEFVPLPFTRLNIKALIIKLTTDAIYDPHRSAEDNTKIAHMCNQLITLVMMILNKLYTLSYNLYKVYSSPDIDVDEFVGVVMSNLGEVQKHVPRCEKAFSKIKESVELLKNNFGTYYKDFTETGNNTIIMENFVLDVAKNTRADADTTRQFRTIIQHYRKIASTQVKNPQLKALFDQMNNNLKDLERKTGNISKVDEESDEDEYEDEEDSSAAPTTSTTSTTSHTGTSNSPTESTSTQSTQNTTSAAPAPTQ